jgi:hypothetical protein
MYDRPGTGIAVQVVDGELTVEKAALSRLEVGVIGQPSTG